MNDIIQQLRTEVNERVNSRMDLLNSISVAMQNMSTRANDSTPYRISDLIPRSWEGNNEKGEFRSFMSDLHLWMQAWSDQGERILAQGRRRHIGSGLHARRVQDPRDHAVPSVAQNDSK